MLRQTAGQDGQSKTTQQDGACSREWVWFKPHLNGGHHTGGWDFIILVHQQLNGAVLINEQQLSHTLMQHRQQVVLLDEVKDSRLLLPEVDGQGQV